MKTRTIINQFLRTIFFITVGSGVFLLLLNRVIMHMKDGLLKINLIILSFLFIAAVFILFSFLKPRDKYILIPVIIFGILCLGEINRIAIRTLHKGSEVSMKTMVFPEQAGKADTTTALKIRYYSLDHGEYEGPGIRIAHITDLHLSDNLPDSYYYVVNTMLKSIRPDLVLLTGDYIFTPDDSSHFAQFLSDLPPVPCYATLGNHDYWHSTNEIIGIIGVSHVILLRNESMNINIDTTGITLTGCDHPWLPFNFKSYANEEKNKIHIVMSHTPDNIYKLLPGKPDIVFSGHYHGGQLRLPVLGAIIVPSAYGRRFEQGHFIFDDTHLFVSSGIGISTIPLRLFCPPDIIVLDIQ